MPHTRHSRYHRAFAFRSPGPTLPLSCNPKERHRDIERDIYNFHTKHTHGRDRNALNTLDVGLVVVVAAGNSPHPRFGSFFPIQAVISTISGHTPKLYLCNAIWWKFCERLCRAATQCSTVSGLAQFETHTIPLSTPLPCNRNVDNYSVKE